MNSQEIILKRGSIDNIGDIQSVADVAFRETYGSILSNNQLEYMMDMMYSASSLEQQLNAGHNFLLLYEDTTCKGFVSFEHNYKGSAITKLHKLYLLPQYKKKGWGKLLVDEVLIEASKNENCSVQLNMNRNNETHGFYTRIGFSIIGSEDIDIGDGFLMEDYIFEKLL